MKKMGNFLFSNLGPLLLAVIGLVFIYFAIKNFKKPEEVITTKSANFADDPVVSTPVMAGNPHADIFREAAWAAINDGVNPWIYLEENWEKAQKMGTEKALLDFIVSEAHKEIPFGSMVTLSIRDYSNPNSVVMEYRDPATDSVMITTGHDPEPTLYGTFYYKKDSVTFKLICANGLVKELGGKTTSFDQDYIIKRGDSFIEITGCNTDQAKEFARKNSLKVRFVLEGKVYSETPKIPETKVYGDFKKVPGGIFDVVIQPGDILRKRDGEWLYIVSNN